MATFRIHHDKENSDITEIRQKQMAPGQQKRSALSALNHQSLRAVNPKGKQALGVSVQLKPTIVPIAQLEACKVYEDSKENEREVSLVPIKTDKENVKPVQIKKEWFAQEPKPQPPKEVENSESEDVVLDTSEIPMSIEKPALTPESRLTKIKSKEELFFENIEYRNDIYAYLRKLETNNRPKSGYMRKQPDITYNMRTILVDWLVEVSEEYKLQCETLFLAINYVDRFLSYMSVVRGKLQLVGTAAMFIAAKYEEIYPPQIGEFVYITDDTYTKKQVIRMEHLILKVLSFDLSVPTPLTFIKAMSIASNTPEKATFLAMYLSELSMLEADPYIETLPSVMAAAAIAIARYTLNMEPWTADLKRNTGFDLSELKKTMEFLFVLFSKAPAQAQQAVQEKYNSLKYLHVSQLVPRNDRITIDE